jgi:hypothetical protein
LENAGYILFDYSIIHNNTYKADNEVFLNKTKILFIVYIFIINHHKNFGRICFSGNIFEKNMHMIHFYCYNHGLCARCWPIHFKIKAKETQFSRTFLYIKMSPCNTVH